MIVVDTSSLIDSLVGPKRSAPRMRSLIEDGERLALPTLVLYEWWRGPRQSEELAAQEALFPSETSLPFGVEQAGSPPGCTAWCAGTVGGQGICPSPRMRLVATPCSGP